MMRVVFKMDESGRSVQYMGDNWRVERKARGNLESEVTVMQVWSEW